MPIYDFECEVCGEEFDSIQKGDVTFIHCPKCDGKANRVFPRKPSKFNLSYDPKKDICDWDGNTTRFYDEYKKMKAEGQNPRIPALDGDG